MRSVPKKGSFAKCEHCEDMSESGEWEEQIAYYHDPGDILGFENLDEGYYFDTDCLTITVYVCSNCGSATEDRDCVKEVWVCSECDGMYEDKYEGDECCH